MSRFPFKGAQPDMEVMVPIDIIGILTDRNPGGLYW